MTETLVVAGPAVAADPAEVARPVGWREFVRRFRSDRVAVVAAVVLLIIIAAAVLAPLITKYDPTKQDILNRLAPPSSAHWLGTDDLGRDTYSRLIYGARVSLLAGPLAAFVGIVLGAPLGIFVGFRGKSWDAVASRFTDALMSLPPLILAIAAIAVLGKGIWNAMLAIGIVLAPRFFRIMRASSQRISRETYIEASRSIGCSTWRILSRHVGPAVYGVLIVQTTLVLGLAMLGEVALSFIGLGVQPPQASWGSMLANGYQFMRSNPLLIIVPGVAIFVTVLAINYVGEGIRQALGREVARAR